ncbi:MAG: glycosyltransferase family 39 protein [bacterium]
MNKFLKENKIARVIILVAVIFLFSFFAHYFVYRAIGLTSTSYFNLLVSRNWSENNSFAYENANGAVLSLEAVKTQGVGAELGNKLTFLLYGLLFRTTGFHPDLPIFVSFFIYSLCAVILYFIASRHFRREIALTAAFLAILAPYALPFSNAAGTQEWAYLFLTIASFIYFWPKDRKIIYLLLAGLFLGLSAAAKNNFIVAFPAFLVLEFLAQRKNLKIALQRCFWFGLSFLLVAFPFFLIGGNSYFGVMLGVNQSPNEPSYIYGYVFPDPYTFYNKRQEFLREVYVQNQGISLIKQFSFWGDFGMFFKDYGVSIGFFKSEIVTRAFSAWMYFKGLFLSLIVFGGAFSWLLIFLGGQELWRQKKHNWFVFGLSFIVSWLAILTFLKTSNFAHLAVLNLPASIFLALGISRIAKLAAEHFDLEQKSAKMIMGGVTAVLVFFFFQISWWNLHEAYANPGQTRQILAFARNEENKNLFGKNGVTVVGWASEMPEALAYYLDRNFIYFAPSTIKKLAAKNELKQVFKKYGITSFAGYDKELTEIITENTNNELKEITVCE